MISNVKCSKSFRQTVPIHFTRLKEVSQHPVFTLVPHQTCDRDEVLGYGAGFKAALFCSHQGPPHTMPPEQGCTSRRFWLESEFKTAVESEKMPDSEKKI